MRLFKHDMLLFCKERSMRSHILYFVEFDTLDDLSPRIHRYTVGLFAFERFDLSGVYRLEVLDTHIVASKLNGNYELSDPDYLLLMELREMRFIDTDGKCVPFHKENYYSFNETKAITGYTERFMRRLSLQLLRYAAYALALLLPFALYALLLYVTFMGRVPSNAPFRGPILAVGSLPLMVFLMSLLFALVSLFLLQWPVTRYSVLKHFVLRYAGMRKPIVMTADERKHKLINGCISLGLFLLSVVISLLL